MNIYIHVTNQVSVGCISRYEKTRIHACRHTYAQSNEEI